MRFIELRKSLSPGLKETQVRISAVGKHIDPKTLNFLQNLVDSVTIIRRTNEAFTVHRRTDHRDIEGAGG